jgi:hypothetical protein
MKDYIKAALNRINLFDVISDQSLKLDDQIKYLILAEKHYYDALNYMKCNLILLFKLFIKFNS